MNTQSIFQERLPRRPYCSNNLEQGLIIRPADAALNLRHIQPNAPLEVSWLIFDLDYQGAAFGWEKANLPPPTLTVSNPENGHAHLLYGLTTPVGMSDACRAAPIRYAAAIQAAFIAKLHADPSYAGLIAKNPFHDSWKSLWIQHLYDLSELAEYVNLPKRKNTQERIGLGRNCTLFDELRSWAYQWVREYKRNAASAEQWRTVILAQAEKMNGFDVPLSLSEVKGTAKSVAKWTWQRFDNESFSALQSARGKRGGRPKSRTQDGRPWEPLKISRATYYRRLKEGLLVPA